MKTIEGMRATKTISKPTRVEKVALRLIAMKSVSVVDESILNARAALLVCSTVTDAPAHCKVRSTAWEQHHRLTRTAKLCSHWQCPGVRTNLKTKWTCA